MFYWGVNETRPAANNNAAGMATVDKLAPLPDTSGYAMGNATLSNQTLRAIWEWQHSNQSSSTQYVDNTEYARSVIFQVRTHGTEESDAYMLVQNAHRDHFYSQKGTHDFIYRDVQFLYQAAEHYAQLEEGQDYRFRTIDDYTFLCSMFHFFNGRYGNEEEIAQLRTEVDGVVRELAQRIKTGGDTSLGSLTSTLTIGGVEATMGQLMEVQEAAKTLIEAVYTELPAMRETRPVGDIGTRYAQYGMAVAVANSWGESSGNPLGALLGEAVERIAKVELNAKVELLTAQGHDGLAQLQLSSYEAFATMDLTSVESARASLEEGISRFLAQVQGYLFKNPEDEYNQAVAQGAADVLRSSLAQLMEKMGLPYRD